MRSARATTYIARSSPARGTRAFCAGLDLKEFLAATPEQDPERAKIVRRTFSAVRHCAIPVIAAVNGPALGAGCVLASVCDIRLAAPNATFGLPEINVGRCGGGAHMGRHMPQGLLRRMFFTGKPIGAEEAQRFGFVDEIVPADGPDAGGDELAETIAAQGAARLAARQEVAQRDRVHAGRGRLCPRTGIQHAIDATPRMRGRPPARWSKSARRCSKGADHP